MKYHHSRNLCKQWSFPSTRDHINEFDLDKSIKEMELNIFSWNKTVKWSEVKISRVNYTNKNKWKKYQKAYIYSGILCDLLY